MEERKEDEDGDKGDDAVATLRGELYAGAGLSREVRGEKRLRVMTDARVSKVPPVSDNSP